MTTILVYEVAGTWDADAYHDSGPECEMPTQIIMRAPSLDDAKSAAAAWAARHGLHSISWMDRGPMVWKGVA